MSNSPIYVVTCGEYDDYRIITATTDKALAHQIAEKAAAYDKYNTEVATFDDPEIFLKDPWYVELSLCGEVREIRCETFNPDIASCGWNLTDNGFYGHTAADSYKEAVDIAQKELKKLLPKKEGA